VSGRGADTAATGPVGIAKLVPQLRQPLNGISQALEDLAVDDVVLRRVDLEGERCLLVQTGKIGLIVNVFAEFLEDALAGRFHERSRCGDRVGGVAIDRLKDPINLAMHVLKAGESLCERRWDRTGSTDNAFAIPFEARQIEITAETLEVPSRRSTFYQGMAGPPGCRVGTEHRLVIGGASESGDPPCQASRD